MAFDWRRANLSYQLGIMLLITCVMKQGPDLSDVLRIKLSSAIIMCYKRTVWKWSEKVDHVADTYRCILRGFEIITMITKYSSLAKIIKSHAVYTEMCIWDYANLCHESVVHNLQLLLVIFWITNPIGLCQSVQNKHYYDYHISNE